MAAHSNELIHIARGKSSLGRVKNEVISWAQLGELLSKPAVTGESFKAFLGMAKTDQDQLKNVNGYWIACLCKDGIRNRRNLGNRRVITLDLDNLPPKLLEALLNGTTALAAYEWYLHSTRKHEPGKPRIRIVILLKSEVSPDDYDALARIVSWTLDRSMDAIDDVSFRPAQMMYLPSHSKDSVWVWHHNEGKPVDPEAVWKLWRGKGLDPSNYADLPYSEAQGQKRKAAEKAEDPWEKEGPIGAFCRAYPIEDAIATFLSEWYVPGDMNGPKPRYSYAKGTSTNGVEIQDGGRFMYSHHTSDPLSDMLANAFDAVRICKFGHLDADAHEGTKVTNLPSYKAMIDFALKQPAVQRELADRNYGLGRDFSEAFDDLEPDEEEAAPEPAPERPSSRKDEPAGEPGVEDSFEDLPPEEGGKDAPSGATVDDLKKAAKAADRPPEDWWSDLELDGKGKIKGSLANLVVILMNDPRTFRRFGFNLLRQEQVLKKKITARWRFATTLEVSDPINGRPLDDAIVNEIRLLLESKPGEGVQGYGFPNLGVERVDAAVGMAAQRNEFHPMIEWQSKIVWDGKRRNATVLQDWLKVPDSRFAREAFRMMMIAAVTRCFEPGHKFDYALVLQGEQGIGKSTFFRLLAKGEWHGEFTASFDDTKVAMEQTKGRIFVEMSEMESYRGNEIGHFRSYSTRTVDVARAAYGRRPEQRPRQFVLVGTVNPKQFLRDLTGNRRIWPFECGLPRETPFDFDAFEAIVPQIWAEAIHDYREMRRRRPQKQGELNLDLTPGARSGAVEQQKKAQIETQAEVWAAALDAWLETPMRSDQLGDRHSWLVNGEPVVVKRIQFTSQQAWEWGLQRRAEDIDQGKNRYVLAEAINLLPAWEHYEKPVKIDGKACRTMRRKGYTDYKTANQCFAPAAWIDPVSGDDSDLTG